MIELATVEVIQPHPILGRHQLVGNLVIINREVADNLEARGIVKKIELDGDGRGSTEETSGEAEEGS